MKSISSFFTMNFAGLTTSIGWWNKRQTQSKIKRIISEGFLKFLTSLISAALILFNALFALSTYGCACAKSASHCAFSPEIRAASVSHFSLIPLTKSDSRLASKLEISRDPIILFVFSVAIANLACSSLKTTFIASTSSAPSFNFLNPKFTLFDFFLISANFFPYMPLKSAMKLKNDFGVWYTFLRIDLK